MDSLMETKVEGGVNYTYRITGAPSKFLDIEEGNGIKIPIAIPSVKAHAGVTLLRTKRIQFVAISIVVAFILVVAILMYVSYTSGLSYSTTSFSEDDFSLIYSDGNTTLSIVNQTEVMQVLNDGGDISVFSSAIISYTGTPALIGYRIDIQNPDVIFIAGGRIYGISEGRSKIYVYSQDGTYLTTRDIIVE